MKKLLIFHPFWFSLPENEVLSTNYFSRNPHTPKLLIIIVNVSHGAVTVSTGWRKLTRDTGRE